MTLLQLWRHFLALTLSAGTLNPYSGCLVFIQFWGTFALCTVWTYFFCEKLKGSRIYSRFWWTGEDFIMSCSNQQAPSYVQLFKYSKIYLSLSGSCMRKKILCVHAAWFCEALINVFNSRIYCTESGEESSETESVYSLKCHISQEVNHLHEGIKRVSYIGNVNMIVTV